MIKELILFSTFAMSPSLLRADVETCHKQETRDACSALDSCRYVWIWEESRGDCVALPECPEGQYWEPLFGCLTRKGNCGEFDKTDYDTCDNKYQRGGFAYCDWDSLNKRCRYRPPSPG